MIIRYQIKVLRYVQTKGVKDKIDHYRSLEIFTVVKFNHFSSVITPKSNITSNKDGHYNISKNSHTFRAYNFYVR